MTMIWNLILYLSIPLIMVIFGGISVNKPPQKINYLYGYRTARSTKNIETWKFAHEYCGKLWTKIGIAMFILSLFICIILNTLSEEVKGVIGTVLIMVQTIILLISIIPVEKALKKKFDENGNPRF